MSNSRSPCHTIAHIAVKVHNPGPGSYKENELARDGRYARSNEKNSCVPTFKLPIKPKAEERVVAMQYTKDNPGPGSYTPRETSRTNKYRNCYNYQLHSRDRTIELHDKTKLANPGPQKYTLPSDFGYPVSNMSTTSFAIPQSTNKKRTRNGLNHAQSTALLSMNRTTQKAMISQTVGASSIGGDQTDANDMGAFSEQKSVGAKRSLITSTTQKVLKPNMKIKRLSRPKVEKSATDETEA